MKTDMRNKVKIRSILILLIVNTIALNAQCVLSIIDKSVLVPVDTNSKWKDYTQPSLIKKIPGNYRIISPQGEVDNSIISIDENDKGGPDCGPTVITEKDYTGKTNLFGIKGEWNVLPRKIQELPVNAATYVKAVKQQLIAKGLKASPVVIKKIIKTDFDGDGKDEVVVFATSFTDIYSATEKDYSIVIVRRVVNDKLVTDILDFSKKDITAKKDEYDLPSYITHFEYSSIFDVNGDGKMELIISDSVHEGYGIRVFELTTKGFKCILAWGCGA